MALTNGICGGHKEPVLFVRMVGEETTHKVRVIGEYVPSYLGRAERSQMLAAARVEGE